nr:AAA family ATPase [Chitinophagaceae bacterium]
MLTNLYIRNFAIIEELEISFQQGLTIITGETGAGKSILMGALSLILGERADSQSLYNPAEKCIIEGSFDISQLSKVKNLLVAQDFEVHHELIIRRELNAQGRSRVFINDTPTTLAILVPIATLLIDMHRQFDTIELQQSQYQLELIDELAKNEKELIQYQTQYQHWKSLIHKLDDLRQQNKLIKQELDYNQFLYNELEELNLQEEELEQLEQTYQLLSNSETLKSDLQKAVYQIQGDQDPVTIKLKACIQLIESHSKGIQVVEAICSRLQSVLIEVKDIGLELEQLFESTNFDQAQIDQVAERLSEGNRLLKKHHVQTTQELLELKTQLELKINQAVHADDQEEILNKQIDELLSSLKVQANSISLSRKKQIPGVEKKVNELLKKVGMPNAMMKITHHNIELGYVGIDKIEFLFDANQAGKFQPVSKVA